ncbi:MAG: pitrilysin family protein [Candidatus Aminicenantales bacterium]
MRDTIKYYFPGIFLCIAIIVLAACSRVSPNRLSSELIPVDGNPLVSFRILLKVGSANDPAGKEGLCQLTLSMLANGGTKSLTYKELTKNFYPMAARVDLSVDKEMSAFSGAIHIDNLEKYYVLFKGMLLDPGFREEDFIRLKTNQINSIERSLINYDEQFGKEILNLMMYDGHPYGHLEAGTVESVKNLTLDDIRAFYQEHFVQGNIVVGLIGGFPADFAEKVLSDFGGIPEGFTPRLILPEQRIPQGIEIVMAEKQTPSTAISMGFPISLTRANKDFFALWVAGAHFGEHRQHLSLLFQKIREERGQNYGDYAYIEHFVQGRDKFPAPNHCRQQQYFSIWIRPLINSNRHFVLRQALQELKKLIEEGISEERFQMTRTYLLNYTKLYAQTLDERLGWQMDSHYYGYKDILAEVQNRLPRLTREDVNRAIKKYLNFDKIYIALITQDAESLKNDLVANTPSPIQYANPNMPKEILNEDLVIQVYPLDVNMEKVKIALASEYFQKAGLPKLEKP